MNETLCSAFRELSDSFVYHIINNVKAVLCLAGAIRIVMQWKDYGVRFLVHNNTKVLFRFYYAINILISAIFGLLHFAELFRLRYDCVLLDFRYLLLTRGVGVAAIYSSQHVMLILSFERLYSALYPAHFEKCSSKRLALLLALLAIICSFTYSMMQLSLNLALFHEPIIYVALLTANIPENRPGFQNVMRMIVVANCVGLIMLSLDFYINFVRKQVRCASLSISYQRSENRRIVLILLPIELTHVLMSFCSAFSLFVYSKFVSNPTPIHQQLFLESVTVIVYFPLVLTFLIKRSVKIKYRKAPIVDPTIDHFESLQSAWDSEFDKTRNNEMQ